MVRDDLGNRMKLYENVNRNYLIHRVPVIVRIDGKCFHTFTKGFKKPFDQILISSMQQTMKYLCENVMGCVLGYTQSDEISLVLIDYKRLNSCGWFDYNIQKMSSIAASIATMYFNKAFNNNVKAFTDRSLTDECTKEDIDYIHKLKDAVQKGAMFDARVFNVPKEEVTNCILWRQNDATRNSIEMVGQAYFSHKELHGKSCNDIQDMLMLQKNINWNNFETFLKRGSCCRRVEYEFPETGAKRSKWDIDLNIPIFTGDGRKYIEDLVYIGE